MATPPQIRVFQIFRAGTFTPMQGREIHFSEADLQTTASTYDAERKKAPLVLGHPPDNQPEYGKVIGMFVKDGALFAQALVDAALLSLVKAGRYGTVSASFYTPFSADNPCPGAYYLKHVGFLGAMVPAVKGMKPLEFSESSGALCFSEGHSLPLGNYTGYLTFTGSEQLHQLALEHQQACTSLSYMEAATLAHDAINFTH